MMLVPSLILVLGTVFTMVGSAPTSLNTAPPSVVLPQGTFTGTILSDNIPKPVEAFLGVPYAQAPSGDSRYRAPIKVQDSKGSFNAAQYGPGCYDSSNSSKGMSEDCLSINVFRPTGSQTGKLPIAVYIHGGGFNGGTGRDGAMDRMVAVASAPFIGLEMNYRLGALGFLTSKVMAEGNALNLGQKDQIMALQWVQDNIEIFGGDKTKVTLIGDSAGAHSVGHHLQNVAEKGLFSQAILESGAPTARLVQPADGELNEEQFKKFTDLVGASNLTEDSILPYLRSIPIEKIENAAAIVYNAYYGSMRWALQPAIDGSGGVIPEAPITLWQTGNWNKVAILTGFCSNEGGSFIDRGVSKSQEFTDFFQILLPELTPSDFSTIDALYPDPLTDPKSPYQPTPGTGAEFNRLAHAYGQFAYISPARHTAHFTGSLSSPPVYLYEVDANMSAKVGAPHDCARNYVTYQITSDTSTTQKQIAAAVNEYWTSFIVTGDPNEIKVNAPQRAVWPKYTPGAAAPTVNKMVIGRGNDELAGGTHLGIVTQAVTETYAVTEGNFWWAKVMLSEN